MLLTYTGTMLSIPLFGFSGHCDAVKAVTFSPDGTLASGSKDTTLRVWVDAELVKVLEMPGAVNAIAFADDGRMAVGLQDRAVQVWQGGQVKLLEGHTAYIAAVAFAPDGRLASASYDDTARVWQGGQCIRVLEHDDFVAELAFAPDGTLASASDDYTIRWWRPDGSLIKRQEMGTAIYDLSFSPDGILASGSYHVAMLWDKDGNRLQSIGETHTVNTLRYGADGTLAIGCNAGKLRLWKDDQVLAVLEGVDGAIYSLAFVDGRLAAGSQYSSIRLWQDGQALTIKAQHQIISVRFSADGRYLQSEGTDGFKYWDLEGRQVADPHVRWGTAEFGVMSARPLAETVIIDIDPERLDEPAVKFLQQEHPWLPVAGGYADRAALTAAEIYEIESHYLPQVNAFLQQQSSS